MRETHAPARPTVVESRTEQAKSKTETIDSSLTESGKAAPVESPSVSRPAAAPKAAEVQRIPRAAKATVETKRATSTTTTTAASENVTKNTTLVPRDDFSSSIPRRHHHFVYQENTTTRYVEVPAEATISRPAMFPFGIGGVMGAVISFLFFGGLAAFLLTLYAKFRAWKQKRPRRPVRTGSVYYGDKNLEVQNVKRVKLREPTSEEMEAAKQRRAKWRKTAGDRARGFQVAGDGTRLSSSTSASASSFSHSNGVTTRNGSRSAPSSRQLQTPSPAPQSQSPSPPIHSAAPPRPVSHTGTTQPSPSLAHTHLASEDVTLD
eukprot:CAMPEP_0184649474 /NCGR_PEP_ID=MMETSP0308-20130426/6854_1 /TAXON_ID=38269 /ORGANISM="Gloeochaete witrockiana, Strain SAG 46.84" /LENGTH=319 /DNA_ID=CAMNT_0027082231 /DNA_START=411 /DNA_END=1370 /DNA_ORIENTATION=+